MLFDTELTLILADVDECALGTDSCDVNAQCNDTVGSFECTCNSGFIGDGRICGELLVAIFVPFH